MRGRRTQFIRRMKAAGALMRPKRRTVNSKLLKLVLKLVLYDMHVCRIQVGLVVTNQTKGREK